MKKLVLIFVAFLPISLFCQNLVPNGSFEDTLTCPTSLSQLEYANFWINPTLGTPELMHTCGIWPGISPFGYQWPHSGEAFGGFFTGGPNNHSREYIETSLTSQLIAGQCYQLSFYANLGNPRYSTDAIHAYFSDTLIDNVQTNHVLNYNNQISNPPGNFLDTINWTLIQGEYLANGGENFLLFGNFDSSQYCNWIISDSNVVNTQSYIYIDDIILVPIPCTGLSELSVSLINVYPNPVTSNLIISINNNFASEIKLFDSLTRLILTKRLTNNSEINLDGFASGVYHYEIKNNKSIKYGKIIKVE